MYLADVIRVKCDFYRNLDKVRLKTTFQCTIETISEMEVFSFMSAQRDLWYHNLIVLPLSYKIQKGYILRFALVIEINRKDKSKPWSWYYSTEHYLISWKKMQEPISTETETDLFYNIKYYDKLFYNTKDDRGFRKFIRCQRVLDLKKSYIKDLITLEVHVDTNDESELAYIVQEEIEEEIDEARSEATFHYTVKNVTKMKCYKDLLLSPAQYVRNIPWKVGIVPCKRRKRQIRRSFGYFIQCNRESESTSWSCYASAELRLLSWKERQEPFRKTIHHVFHSEADECGDLQFMPWQDVLDPKKGYIKDDSIKLEVFVAAEPLTDIFMDFQNNNVPNIDNF